MRTACVLLAALALAGPLVAADSPAQAQGAAAGELLVKFEGLRSAKGMLRACLTRDATLFLHCDRDPAAFKGSVTAGKDALLEFANVPPGDYALTVLHDENGNKKVDTFMGIPKEGVGFSRNPVMHFGPPRWDAVRIHISSGASETDVKLKYFL